MGEILVQILYEPLKIFQEIDIDLILTYLSIKSKFILIKRYDIVSKAFEVLQNNTLNKGVYVSNQELEQACKDIIDLPHKIDTTVHIIVLVNGKIYVTLTNSSQYIN